MSPRYLFLRADMNDWPLEILDEGRMKDPDPGILQQSKTVVRTEQNILKVVHTGEAYRH